MSKFACALIATVFLPATIASAQNVVVKAPALVDPASGTILKDQVILIEGKLIKEVGSNVAVPRDAAMIDLKGLTVLPGLIDCHTHVFLEPEDERGVPPVITKSQATRTVEAVAAARKDLESGFTTLRDLDSEGAGFADVALREGINRGLVPGPRLLVSTYALTITGGHMNNVGLNPDMSVPEGASLTDSRDAMVAEIRRQVKYGADWIKIYATGRMSQIDPATLEPLTQFSVDDVRAAVAEAARWRRDVAAHAYGGDGAKNAVLGGVRSIEHGMLLTDEILKLMSKNGTFWVPTMSVYLPQSQDEDTDLRRRVVARHREAFRKAMDIGVKIAFGTDVGAFDHGTEAREFLLMVDYGMTPLEAIRAATTRAAELLRMESHIGTIEAGKFADIIATEGNPLSDIKAIQRVVFVMKDGKIYKR